MPRCLSFVCSAADLQLTLEDVNDALRETSDRPRQFPPEAEGLYGIDREGLVGPQFFRKFDELFVWDEGPDGPISVTDTGRSLQPLFRVLSLGTMRQRLQEADEVDAEAAPQPEAATNPGVVVTNPEEYLRGLTSPLRRLLLLVLRAVADGPCSVAVVNARLRALSSLQPSAAGSPEVDTRFFKVFARAFCAPDPPDARAPISVSQFGRALLAWDSDPASMRPAGPGAAQPGVQVFVQDVPMPDAVRTILLLVIKLLLQGPCNVFEVNTKLMAEDCPRELPPEDQVCGAVLRVYSVYYWVAGRSVLQVVGGGGFVGKYAVQGMWVALPRTLHQQPSLVSWPWGIQSQNAWFGWSVGPQAVEPLSTI